MNRRSDHDLTIELAFPDTPTGRMLADSVSSFDIWTLAQKTDALRSCLDKLTPDEREAIRDCIAHYAALLHVAGQATVLWQREFEQLLHHTTDLSSNGDGGLAGPPA